MTRRSPRLAWWGWALGALLLLGALLGPALRSERTLVLRDALPFAAPHNVVLRAAAARGRLAEWDPSQHAGVPFAASPPAQALYPPRLFAVLLAGAGGAPEAPTDGSAAFHLLLALIGAAALGRELGLRPAERAAMAVLYAGSGPVLSLLDNLPSLTGAAWLPASAALLLRARRRGCARSLLLAALGLSAPLYGGAPQEASWLVALAVGLWVWRGDGGRGARRRAAELGALGLGAALIAAPVLLPPLALLPHTTRAAMDYGEVGAWSLHPARLLELLIPLPLGLPFPERGLDLGAAVEPVARETWTRTIFCGAAALLLAARACGRLPDRLRASRRLLLAVAVVGALLATGRHTPVHPALAAWTPYAVFRYPEKHTVLLALAVAGLAGLGLHALRRDPWAGRRAPSAGGDPGSAATEQAAGRGADRGAGRAADRAAGRAGDPAVAQRAGERGRGASPEPERSPSGRQLPRVASGVPLRTLAALAAVPLAVLLAWPVLAGWTGELAREVGRTAPDLGVQVAAVVLLQLALLLLLAVPGPSPRRRHLAIALLIALQAAAFGRRLVFVGPAELARELPPAALALRARTAGATFPSRVLRFPAGAPGGKFGRAPADQPSAIAATAVALMTLEGASAALYGLEGLHGMSGFQPRRVQRLLGLDPDLGAALARSATGYLVAPADWERPSQQDLGLGVALHTVAARPRVEVLSGVRWVHDEEAGWAALRGVGPEAVVAVGTPTSPPNPAPSVARAAGSLKAARRPRPEAIELSVSAEEAALVVVRDAWFPGWRATVSGAPAPVHVVDGAFMGVQVPAGESEVILRYRTPGLRLGLLLALCAALAGGVVWVVAGRSVTSARARR